MLIHDRFIGKTILELNFPSQMIFGAICRGNNIFIKNDVVLEKNDKIIFLLPDKGYFSKAYKQFN